MLIWRFIWPIWMVTMVSVMTLSKWRPLEIFQCQDIIIYLHMKCRWNRTMLNLCGIVKLATARNFSMSGHHNLPTYEMALKSDNAEFVRYCGGHFENGDRYKFFNVGNEFGTSLSTHILNFDDIRKCWIFTTDSLCRVLAAILKMTDFLKILEDAELLL